MFHFYTETDVSVDIGHKGIVLDMSEGMEDSDIVRNVILFYKCQYIFCIALSNKRRKRYFWDFILSLLNISELVYSLEDVL